MVEGQGLRTRYEGNPHVSVESIEDGALQLTVTFQSAEARRGDPVQLTRLNFSSVIEYRWIAFDEGYDHGNRDDFEFALIEIIDSEQIEVMLTGGIRRNRPRGQRFADHLDESAIHHYRIGFNNHGTFDVICLGLSIDRFQNPT